MLRALARTAKSLAGTIQLMEDNIYTFPPDVVATAGKLVRRFLLGYLWLAHDAFIAKEKLYKLRPKSLARNLL